MHNSCVQVRTMGNHPSSTNSDSDEELYDTPPETLETESDPEMEDDNPNAPEITEDDLTEDEDIDELQNRPENDTGISVGNLLNFPDLLRLNTPGQDTSKSEAGNSDNETFPPSHSRGARPKLPLPTGKWSNWRHPPLREVTLPQLYQPPEAEGCCIPPYKEPPEPWAGFGMEENMMKFIKENIPCCEDDCKNCETNTEHNLGSKEGTFYMVQIDDIEKYTQTSSARKIIMMHLNTIKRCTHSMTKLRFSATLTKTNWRI